jgi:hypothetical protein
MLEGRRGGERRQHAPQSVCTRRKHERSSHALTRTRPSLGPSARARQSSLRTRGNSSGGAYEPTSRLGKPGEPGGTSTGVGADGRSAARRMSPPAREGVACREKEGGRGLRPYEDQRDRVWLPARRSAVAEVGRRRLVPNKLGIALQKERTESSERGPSSG